MVRVNRNDLCEHFGTTPSSCRDSLVTSFSALKAAFSGATHCPYPHPSDRPARPPRVAYDSVVEGLAATRRTFELPGRMTLPEIIEVFTDIWEVESTL